MDRRAVNRDCNLEVFYKDAFALRQKVLDNIKRYKELKYKSELYNNDNQGLDLQKQKRFYRAAAVVAYGKYTQLKNELRAIHN